MKGFRGAKDVPYLSFEYHMPSQWRFYGILGLGTCLTIDVQMKMAWLHCNEYRWPEAKIFIDAKE